MRTPETELLDDSFGRASGWVTDVEHPMLGEHPRLTPLVSLSRSGGAPAPGCSIGEQTDQVLAWLGYDAARIADLRDRQVVGVSRTTASRTDDALPKLNHDEIERLLTGNGLLRIATIGADGSPLVVPVGYLYRDGEIMITAREKVTWLADIRRDPRVCITIDDGRYPLPKVTIKGIAEIRHEPGEDDLWRDRRLPLDAPEPPAPDRVPTAPAGPTRRHTTP